MNPDRPGQADAAGQLDTPPGERGTSAAAPGTRQDKDQRTRTAPVQTAGPGARRPRTHRRRTGLRGSRHMIISFTTVLAADSRDHCAAALALGRRVPSLLARLAATPGARCARDRRRSPPCKVAELETALADAAGATRGAGCAERERERAAPTRPSLREAVALSRHGATHRGTRRHLPDRPGRGAPDPDALRRSRAARKTLRGSPLIESNADRNSQTEYRSDAMSQIQIPKTSCSACGPAPAFPSPPAVAMQVIALAQDPDIDLARVADTVSARPGDRRQGHAHRQLGHVCAPAPEHQSAPGPDRAGAECDADAGPVLHPGEHPEARTHRRASTSRPTGSAPYFAATWGKLLASEFGRRDAEEVFLAALLQDIGMLAVDKIAPDIYAGISAFQIEHNRVSPARAELHGTDHRSVGAWLLKSWNMPAALVRGVQHSHDPSAGGVEPERPRVRALRGAVRRDGRRLADGPERDRHPPRRRAGSPHLGILPNRLAEMFAIIREQIPVAEGLFEMQMFPSDQLQDIVDTARETLVVRNLYEIDKNKDLEKRRSPSSRRRTRP